MTEVMPSFLKNPEKALQFYLEHGYYIEPNIFSNDECDQLIDAASQLENAKNGTYRPQMMPHRQNEIYLTAMRNHLLVSIINKLVGGTAAGLQTELFYCKP